MLPIREKNESKSGPRDVAMRVLRRVAKDGAWAAPTLDAELQRSGLDERDASLATAIVYGTLRVLPSLDAWLGGFLKRTAKVDDVALAALRAAAFQLRHLERVPSHAVVDETVTFVRRERGPKVGGFVNAVARRLAASRPSEPSPPTVVELPAPVAALLERALGSARLDAFTRARPLPPPLDLCVLADIDETERALRDARPSAEIWRAGTPRTLRTRRLGDPRRLPGYAEGAFVVQELGSQRVVELMDVQPGERIVDACAGHGGKTVRLAHSVGAAGSITAIELHEGRLEKIPRELHRLGVSAPVTLEVLDLSVGVGGLEAGFDRVLVDAPCSGLGTLHRRPELLLRFEERALAELAALQRAILGNAARLVKPGGMLMYAVCSPAREEGIDVARAFEAPGMCLDPVTGADDDGVLRLGPWSEAECDAYQVIRWKRDRRIDRPTAGS